MGKQVRPIFPKWDRYQRSIADAVIRLAAPPPADIEIIPKSRVVLYNAFGSDLCAANLPRWRCKVQNAAKMATFPVSGKSAAVGNVSSPTERRRAQKLRRKTRRNGRSGQRCHAWERRGCFGGMHILPQGNRRDEPMVEAKRRGRRPESRLAHERYNVERAFSQRWRRIRSLTTG